MRRRPPRGLRWKRPGRLRPVRGRGSDRWPIGPRWRVAEAGPAGAGWPAPARGRWPWRPAARAAGSGPAPPAGEVRGAVDFMTNQAPAPFAAVEAGRGRLPPAVPPGGGARHQRAGAVGRPPADAARRRHAPRPVPHRRRRVRPLLRPEGHAAARPPVQAGPGRPVRLLPRQPGAVPLGGQAARDAVRLRLPHDLLQPRPLPEGRAAPAARRVERPGLDVRRLRARRPGADPARRRRAGAWSGASSTPGPPGRSGSTPTTGGPSAPPTTRPGCTAPRRSRRCSPARTCTPGG